MNRVLPILVLAGSVQLQAATASTKTPAITDERAPSTVVPSGIGNGETNDTSCTGEGEFSELKFSVTSYISDTSNDTNKRDGNGAVDMSCHDVSGNTSKQEFEKPKREGCGWVNPNGVGCEVKDDSYGKAKFGEFPWMVAILKFVPLIEYYKDSWKINVYLGGGSLIHPSVVLTAAHPAVNAPNLKIRAGEWATQNTKEIYPFQDRDVKSYVVHKDFNSGNMSYDVALLFLKSPVEMAPNVGVACLPPPEEPAKAGTHCFATGWGRLGMKCHYATILKKVETTVVDRETCQNRFQTTTLGRLFQLDTSFMCAGAEPGKGTCKGDEGSPLVCPIKHAKERYVQNGVYVWGVDCGQMGIPGVYVDVSVVRNWIDEKVIEKGYQPEVYQYV